MKSRRFFSIVLVCCLLCGLLFSEKAGVQAAGQGQQSVNQLTLEVPKNHTVKLEIGENGSVETGGETYTGNKEIKVERLAKQSYKVKPEWGYRLQEIVYKVDGKKTELKKNGNIYTAPSLNRDGAVLKVTFRWVGGTVVTPKPTATPTPEPTATPTPIPEEPVLPAVTGLTASPAGMNRVALNWDKMEGADGYLIIALGGDRMGTQIGYTTRTNWVDRWAESDQFQFYWVQPYVQIGEERILRGELGGYQYAIGRVVGKTDSVTAEATEKGISLSWDEVPGANGYVILSRTGADAAEFDTRRTTETNAFLDTDVTSKEVKFYWVYATFTTDDGIVVAAGKTSPYTWAVAK